MSEKKAKMYNYNFSASETVHYDIDIQATSLEEAEDKLCQMQSDELDECIRDTSNWWSELSYSDEDEDEDEEEKDE